MNVMNIIHNWMKKLADSVTTIPGTEITPQEAHKLFDSAFKGPYSGQYWTEEQGYVEFVPLGLFWLKDGDVWVGIDNRTGDAWTEEFADVRELVKWMNDEPAVDRHGFVHEY